MGAGASSKNGAKRPLTKEEKALVKELEARQKLYEQARMASLERQAKNEQAEAQEVFQVAMVRLKEASLERARAEAEAERAALALPDDGHRHRSGSRGGMGSSRGRPASSSSVSWAPGTAPPSQGGSGGRPGSGGHVIAVRPRSRARRPEEDDDDDDDDDEGSAAEKTTGRAAEAEQGAVNKVPKPPGAGWTRDRSGLAATLAYKHAQSHALARARQQLPWVRAMDQVVRLAARKATQAKAQFNLPVPGEWGGEAAPEAAPEAGWSLDPDSRAAGLEKKRKRLGAPRPRVPKHLDADDAAHARRRQKDGSQTLDWACNGLTEVTNRQLQELKAKTSLDLSHNPLGFLPVALGAVGARTLRHLSLHDCNFDDAGLPMSLFTGLACLEALDLSANLLTTLGPAFGDIKALKKLVAHSNRLLTVDDHLGQLTKLTHLELQHNLLTALPPGLIRLKSLTYLDAEHNRVDFLPVFFGRGQRGAASTCNLRALRRLNLGDNHLLALPAGFAGLGACESLWLQRNFLGALPADLGDLRALRTLSAFGNRLRALPDSVGQLGRCLETCALNDNHLGPALPESLPRCVALVSLDLSDNELVTLPQRMGDLVNLKHLWLARNRLEALPDSLGTGCAALETLLLHDNKLAALPNNCAALGGTLRTLTLASNRLEKLPPTFRSLAALERLSLDHNATFVVANMPGDVFTRLESLDALSLDSLLLDGLEPHNRAWLQTHVRDLKVVKSIMSKGKMAARLFGAAANTGKGQEALKI